MSVVPATWEVEAEESLEPKKAEVAVSQNRPTALHPRQQSEIPSQIKKKNTIQNLQRTKTDLQEKNKQAHSKMGKGYEQALYKRRHT